MKELGIEGYRPPVFKRTTIGDASVENSPNLLRAENIVPSQPNQVWTTDITYIATKEGWMYLCVFLDLYSRKVVGWSIDDNMKADLVLRAFNDAIRQRKPGKGLIVHSDCGGQYKSKRFRRLLWRKKIRQNMTAGNCYDNANAESFFGSLKSDIIRGKKFSSKEEARAAVFEYVEVFYNRVRLHSALGYQSPNSFEENVA